MRELFNFKIQRYGDESQIVFFSKPMLRGSFDDEDNKQDSITSQQPISVDKQSFSDDEIYKVRGYDSLYRSFLKSKQSLYDYARSNVWEWFCTFTTSPSILEKKAIDRYDETAVLKSILKWFSNTRIRYANDLIYVIVPELHKDGAVHLHALISNIPKDELTRVKGGVYRWDRYEKAFGFSNISRVKDTKKVSSYITKYVTKDLLIPRDSYIDNENKCPWGSVDDSEWKEFERKAAFYRHRYYVSHGVKKSIPEYYDYNGSLGCFIADMFPSGSVQHCRSVKFGDDYINYIQIKEDI